MKAAAYAGHMEACATCPSSTNCCTRHLQRSIGSAFLFESEVVDIEAATGRLAKEFTESRQPSHKVLKFVDEGCVFFRAGKCQIYENRPFDCRVFPFDIRLNENGLLVWIAYDKVCAASRDYQQLFASVKALFTELNVTRGELELYTRKKSLSSDPSQYIELEPVNVATLRG